MTFSTFENLKALVPIGFVPLCLGPWAILAEPKIHGWISARTTGHEGAFAGSMEFLIACAASAAFFCGATWCFRLFYNHWAEKTSWVMLIFVMTLLTFGIAPLVEQSMGDRMPSIRFNSLWHFTALGWGLSILKDVFLWEKWQQDSKKNAATSA